MTLRDRRGLQVSNPYAAPAYVRARTAPQGPRLVSIRGRTPHGSGHSPDRVHLAWPVWASLACGCRS
jgi:hypothetical protein